MQEVENALTPTNVGCVRGLSDQARRHFLYLTAHTVSSHLFVGLGSRTDQPWASDPGGVRDSTRTDHQQPLCLRQDLGAKEGVAGCLVKLKDNGQSAKPDAHRLNGGTTGSSVHTALCSCSLPIGSLSQVCTGNQAKDYFTMGIRSLAKCSQSLPQVLPSLLLFPMLYSTL